MSSQEHSAPPWRQPVLIVNAGSRSGAREMEQARMILESLGVPLRAAERVPGAELIACIRRHMGDGADLIIVGGGDGTLRLAAEAMHGQDVTLGALPLGTGNNFARDLRLPLDLSGACQALVKGRTRWVELGVAEWEDGTNHVFVNAAHIGLFGLANRQTETHLKRRYGHFAYLIGGWRAWRAFLPFELHMTSGKTTKRWRVIQVSAVLGHTYAGGVGRIPGETLQDRRMTLTVMKEDKIWNIMAASRRLIRARSSRPANIHRYRLTEACLVAHPPQPVNLDGEIAGDTPVTFRVLPHALKVIIGESPVITAITSRRSWAVAAGIGTGLLAGAWVLRRRHSAGKEAASPPEKEE